MFSDARKILSKHQPDQEQGQLMPKVTAEGNNKAYAIAFSNHHKNQVYDHKYLGIQLGDDFSTSQVAKSFIGTGLTPIPKALERSAAISVSFMRACSTSLTSLSLKGLPKQTHVILFSFTSRGCVRTPCSLVAGEQPFWFKAVFWPYFWDFWVTHDTEVILREMRFNPCQNNWENLEEIYPCQMSYARCISHHFAETQYASVESLLRFFWVFLCSI